MTANFSNNNFKYIKASAHNISCLVSYHLPELYLIPQNATLPEIETSLRKRITNLKEKIL